MRVLIDSLFLRRPHTGTARWIHGVLDALNAVPDVQATLAPGPSRIGRGWLFRPLNMIIERWWYEFGVTRAARHEGADVLFMPNGYAARRSSIPQVVAILDVNFLTRPGTYEPLFTRYATWAMARAGRTATRTITISAFSRDEIAHHLGLDAAKIDVVYPGLAPLPEGEFPRPIADRYALYVGATEVSKNLGILIDAWEESSPAGLKLAIVGQPGRDHANLSARASTLEGRVELYGRVSPDELEAWYRNADVFLFPSLTEGFGFPPLEAMQRSVPVISSNSGSLPEVLGDAALYHDPADASAVRTHVERLSSDPELRARMVREGLAQAAAYPWSKTGSKLATILAEAIANHSQRR